MKGRNTMKVLYGILIALAVFIVITLIRAIFFVPKTKKYEPLEDEHIDVDRVAKHLSGAIQIPTVSYPENEKVDWAKFDEFHKYLEESYPLIHKNLEREDVAEASLIYRWKGKNPDLEPIALLGHQDVVPIEAGTEEDWTHEPFAGVNDGEFIWGRGALDMKNHLICVMEAVEALLEDGYQPERDVYLLFGHNEEVVASDHSGAKAIMNTLKQRGIHLDSVLDEGGAIIPVHIKNIMDANLAGIGIAEKGYADFEISVSAKGGHSSQPRKHSAIGELAEVIKDIEGHQFKSKLEPFISTLFSKIGRRATYPARIVTCNIWLLKPLIKLIMKQIPASAALIRTTTAVTMAEGSPAANVLPQVASVTVNFRMMPGVTTKDVEKHLRKVIKNKNVEIKCLKSKEASLFSPTDSRAFNAMDELCMRSDPKNIVAPYLMMGGTDACFYEPVCDNIYRFAPFHLSPRLLSTTHATNERCPIEILDEGVSFFKRYIKVLTKD